MGEKVDAILRSGLTGFSLFEHTENIRKSTIPPVCYLYLRSYSYVSIYRRNDRQNVHPWYIEGNITIFVLKKI